MSLDHYTNGELMAARARLLNARENRFYDTHYLNNPKPCLIDLLKVYCSIPKTPFTFGLLITIDSSQRATAINAATSLIESRQIAAQMQPAARSERTGVRL